MFAHSRTVKLSETDATGIVYFTEIQKFAIEAFEEYLHTRGFGVLHIIESEEFLAPIVHITADYLMPITAGDLVSVHMTLEKIGVSSFTIKYEVKKDQSDFDVAIVKITQVTVDKQTKHATPISRALIDILKMI